MMDKQTRLAQIMQSIKEFQLAEDSALYGLELNTRSREYGDVLRCAKKLVDISLQVEDLRIEAKSIQEAIEDEAKEDLL